MPAFERIIPLLVYKDIQAAHDFLVRAFGFESGGVVRNADGHPRHGEVRAGSATIWLHRVTPEHEDAHYDRARASGAHIDSGPQDMPYGQREYGARDIEGHRWWFATPQKQAS